jgi:type IV secretory pathway TrbL component
VLTPSASSVRLAGQSPPAPTAAAASAAAAVPNESAEANQQRLAEAAVEAAAKAVRAGEREDISKAQVSYNLHPTISCYMTHCAFVHTQALH